MKRKLRDARGETLVEALASILIGALSVALLFSAVMASARMDRGAEQTDAAFHASLRAAEEQAISADPSIVSGGAKVTVENKDIFIVPTAEPSVNFYGGNGAISYALPADTGEGGEGP